MNYEIGFSPEEIAIMRQSLDIIQISGKSARVIAGLQDKLDEAIMNIQFTIETEEAKKQEPPTAQDIKQHARFQIQQTEPIPSGRKIDVIIPRYKGPGRPPGNFPGFDDAEKDDSQVDITIERDEDKTASVFNYRKLIK